MNLMDLREAMGLTTAQVAEELGVPRQDVEDSEETGSTWLLQPFIAAFPINPEILKDENIDPFLDSYVQNTVRDRAVEWREKNGLSIERMAAALEMTAEQLAAAEESGRITRALGTKIEKTVGMNRKWLMYGDGRKKGTCILKLEKPAARGRNADGEKAKTPAHTAPNRDGGKRMKDARKEAGLTRERMAEMLGVSVSRIAQMESGYVKDSKVEEVISRIQPETGRQDPGMQLREARKTAGLKLKEAAEIVGLAAGTLAAMECGHISMRRANELIEAIRNAQNTRDSADTLSRDAGIRIRDARKSVGMSQKELGVILRMPESRVARLELGNVTEMQAEEIIRRIQGAPRHRSTGTKKVRKTAKILLGRQVRDAREAAGLSQKAVGDLVGFPQSRISLIERGQVDESTTAEILRAIEEVMAERERPGTEAE